MEYVYVCMSYGGLLKNATIKNLRMKIWCTPRYMITIPLCTHRYIGLRNSGWAEISVFLMVIHDCICTCVYMYVCKEYKGWCACVYICTCVYMYVCSACIHTHSTHTHINTHKYTQTYTRPQNTQNRMHIHLHPSFTRTHTSHTHTHTHTHTHKPHTHPHTHVHERGHQERHVLTV